MYKQVQSFPLITSQNNHWELMELCTDLVYTADGPLADILQQALLPVVGHDICSQDDWWSILATDKMVCAGGDGITAGCNVSS